jgi:hypothetical protein
MKEALRLYHSERNPSHERRDASENLETGRNLGRFSGLIDIISESVMDCNQKDGAFPALSDFDTKTILAKFNALCDIPIRCKTFLKIRSNGCVGIRRKLLSVPLFSSSHRSHSDLVISQTGNSTTNRSLLKNALPLCFNAHCCPAQRSRNKGIMGYAEQPITT